MLWQHFKKAQHRDSSGIVIHNVVAIIAQNSEDAGRGLDAIIGRFDLTIEEVGPRYRDRIGLLPDQWEMRLILSTLLIIG